MATTQTAISKKRKFVADGVFYAELNEFFQVGSAEFHEIKQKLIHNSESWQKKVTLVSKSE